MEHRTDISLAKPNRLILLLACASAAAASMAAVAQPAGDTSRLVVPLSDPSRPAVLDVEIFNGRVVVTGYDGDEIIIEADGVPLPNDDPEPERPDREGLTRIGGSSMGLTAEELDNTVTIRAGGFAVTANLEITVPRLTSVRASTVNGSVLSLNNVEGSHELSNINGGVSAVDVAGSMTASSTNGLIEMSFTSLNPAAANSFSTFNGDIDVTLPGDLDAVFRISTSRGEILTDFDVDVQPRQTDVQRGNGPGFRVSVNQDVRAVVGDGGPEIRFQSFNGDVLIRRR